jgi:hypothetical protein
MSSIEERWDALAQGVDCPLCLPRAGDTPFWLKVRTLRVSTLYLDRNQTYRGHCQLVFDEGHVSGWNRFPETSSQRSTRTSKLRLWRLR